MKISLAAALAALTQDPLSILTCVMLAQIAERVALPWLYLPLFLGYLTLVIRSAGVGDDAKLPQAVDIPSIAGYGCGATLLFGLSAFAASLIGLFFVYDGRAGRPELGPYAPVILAVLSLCLASMVWVAAVVDRWGPEKTPFSTAFGQILVPSSSSPDPLVLLGLAGVVAWLGWNPMHNQVGLVVTGFIYAHGLGQYARKVLGFQLR